MWHRAVLDRHLVEDWGLVVEVSKVEALQDEAAVDVDWHPLEVPVLERRQLGLVEEPVPVVSDL